MRKLVASVVEFSEFSGTYRSEKFSALSASRVHCGTHDTPVEIRTARFRCDANSFLYFLAAWQIRRDLDSSRAGTRMRGTARFRKDFSDATTRCIVRRYIGRRWGRARSNIFSGHIFDSGTTTIKALLGLFSFGVLLFFLEHEKSNE